MLRKLSVVLTWIIAILTAFFVLGTFAAIFKWVDRPLATLVAEISIPTLFGVVALLLLSLLLEKNMDARAERRRKKIKKIQEINEATQRLNTLVSELRESMEIAIQNARLVKPPEYQTLEDLKECRLAVEGSKVPSDIKALNSSELNAKFNEQVNELKVQLNDEIKRVEVIIDDDGKRKQRTEDKKIERKVRKLITECKALLSGGKQEKPGPLILDDAISGPLVLKDFTAHFKKAKSLLKDCVRDVEKAEISVANKKALLASLNEEVKQINKSTQSVKEVQLPKDKTEKRPGRLMLHDSDDDVPGLLSLN